MDSSAPLTDKYGLFVRYKEGASKGQRRKEKHESCDIKQKTYSGLTGGCRVGRVNVALSDVLLVTSVHETGFRQSIHPDSVSKFTHISARRYSLHFIRRGLSQKMADTMGLVALLSGSYGIL